MPRSPGSSATATPDQDGYLEYETRSTKGLVNRCWNDSWNSMLLADGRLAEPPSATCELQGYVYDARLRAARLARALWDDRQLADRLECEAKALRRRFNDDFWSERRGHYVLALDGRKQDVDALTSNIGHLLWSGIVDVQRAERVARQRLSPKMSTGWSRTMSAEDAGSNPIEYHNGTVWPHDTAIIAEGLRSCGFREEASRLAMPIIDAAGYLAYRLPEVFAGSSREETAMPVEYPIASRPQAWAAGPPLMALRTLLGLDVIQVKLHSDPHLPAGLGLLALNGMSVCGQRTDAPAHLTEAAAS